MTGVRLEVAKCMTSPVTIKGVTSPFVPMSRTSQEMHPVWEKFELHWFTYWWRSSKQVGGRQLTKRLELFNKYSAVVQEQQLSESDYRVYLEFESEQDLMTFMLEWS